MKTNSQYLGSRNPTDAFINRNQAILRSIALCVAILSPMAIAKDGYVPFIESLETTQSRAYIKAAARGQDDLPNDSSEFVVNAVVADAAIVDSTLERSAEERSGALSLEETQQGQLLTTDLEQYGYSIFNKIPSNLARAAGIPVPVAYRLGPGDNVIVQLFGKRNVEYQLVVTRDGDILVPEYGPVRVNGLTFDELEKLLTDGFERRVIGAKAVVTLGKLRSIQIRLSGDVIQPGVYNVSGLSTLVDALLTTGGVDRTGSLRNIQLIRDGKRIATLDLYDLLQRGVSLSDHFLQHNDTIFVPPIGEIVYIGGEVQRPAIYELGNERTVEQILLMAGGMLPTASLGHSIIERILSNGTRTLIDFSTLASARKDNTILQTEIHNGDFLRILPLEEKLEDVVVVSGHVRRPGAFQFREGMRVSDILNKIEMLLPGADLDFLLVKREQENTLRTEVLFASLIDAINEPGSADDLTLRARDEILIFSLAQQRENAVKAIVKELEVQGTDYRPARLLEVNGAVRFTGTLPMQEDAKLLDILALAGGTKLGTDLNYGVIARTLHPTRDIRVIPFNLIAAMSDPTKAANKKMAPGDRVYFFDSDTSREPLLRREIEALREQASYGLDEQLVYILGQVEHAGTYPLVQGMRASDLLCAANGLTRKAYALGAQLSSIARQTHAENTVEHVNLDSGALLELCNIARQIASGLASEEQRSQFHSDYNNNATNPSLEAMDQITFSEKSGWADRATVKLSGEVKHPGIYAIDRNETLCSVVQRAGGLTHKAYNFGASFTRISIRDMQQKTVDELQAQLDDLMIELSLSHSFNNDEKASEEWAGKQDYLKAIRQIERAEATGRMVINLKKALECKKRYDIVLEHGDELAVPTKPSYVQVAGQVYVPTSHLYSDDRKISDYVELSGGHTVLGRLRDTYVIQPNGEVLNFKGSRASSKITRAKVMPGARIYVPINVDRMNGTEKAQTWVSSLIQSAILAGLIL